MTFSCTFLNVFFTFHYHVSIFFHVKVKNGGRATSIMVVSPEVSPSGTYIAKWY
jgi:uncharacterized protein YodC (DUF2158 family)